MRPLGAVWKIFRLFILFALFENFKFFLRSGGAFLIFFTPIKIIIFPFDAGRGFFYPLYIF